jgi:hypothetical protein
MLRSKCTGPRRHYPGRLFAPSGLAINKVYSIFLIEPAEARYVLHCELPGQHVSGLALIPLDWRANGRTEYAFKGRLTAYLHKPPLPTACETHKFGLCPLPQIKRL